MSDLDEKHIKKIAEEAAAEGAAEGVKKTLLIFGIDVARPLEVQKNNQYIQQQREARDALIKHSRVAVITVLVSGFIAVLGLGLKEIFK